MVNLSVNPYYFFPSSVLGISRLIETFCESRAGVTNLFSKWLSKSRRRRYRSSPVPYARFVYPRSEGKIRRISERKLNFSHKISVMTLKVFYKNRNHMHFSNFLTYFYLSPFDAETDMFE